jgi:AcrR family transcriptional regulator
MRKKKKVARHVSRGRIPPDRTRSPRGAVTADRIIETAVRIIDKTGLEDFTVKQISDELGCVPTAIYWHYRSKDALLEAVLDMASPPKLPDDGVGPWDERARVICRSIRSNLRQHPYILTLSRRFPGRAVGPTSKAFAAVAREAGYAGAEAAAVARLLVKLAVGFSAREGEDDTTEVLENASYRTALLEQAATADDVNLFLQYATVNQGEIFEAALEFVLEALRRRAPVLKRVSSG